MFKRVLVIVSCLFVAGLCFGLSKANELSYKRASNSVIYVQRGNYHGSGFQVKADSGKEFLITARHLCIESPDGYLYATNVDLKGLMVRRKIIGMSFEADVCAVEALPDVKPFKIAKKLEHWEEVIYAGFPAQLGLSIFTARILGAVQYTIGGFTGKYVMLNNGVIGGNSGGPVLNKKLEIVGLISLHDDNGLGGFVSFPNIVKFIGQI